MSGQFPWRPVLQLNFSGTGGQLRFASNSPSSAVSFLLSSEISVSSSSRRITRLSSGSLQSARSLQTAASSRSAGARESATSGGGRSRRGYPFGDEVPVVAEHVREHVEGPGGRTPAASRRSSERSSAGSSNRRSRKVPHRRSNSTVELDLVEHLDPGRQARFDRVLGQDALRGTSAACRSRRVELVDARGRTTARSRDRVRRRVLRRRAAGDRAAGAGLLGEGDRGDRGGARPHRWPRARRPGRRAAVVLPEPGTGLDEQCRVEVGARCGRARPGRSARCGRQSSSASSSRVRRGGVKGELPGRGACAPTRSRSSATPSPSGSHAVALDPERRCSTARSEAPGTRPLRCRRRSTRAGADTRSSTSSVIA